MGLGNTTGALPIANGGTGSTTAANARSALGLGDLSTKSLKSATYSTTTDASGNIKLVSGSYRKIVAISCTQARAFAWLSNTGGQSNTYASFYEFGTDSKYAQRTASGEYWYIE